MKHLILALSTLVLTAHAEARSMKRFVSSELITVTPQAHTYLAEQTPIGGQLKMDVITGEMHLVLTLPGTCPRNAFCIWAGPAPIQYKFETATVTKGGCGETITTSKTQPIEDGGPYGTLTVTDYSTLICKYMPAAWVEVELNIHGFINERHTMTGERFY